MTKQERLCVGIASLVGFCLLVSGGRARAGEAEDVITQSGVQGGLIVHVGCGPSTSSGQAGELTAALRASDRHVVHGLDTDAGNVAKARRHFASKGLGGVVSAAVFDGKRLPYIDNLVNLLVADKLGDVPMREVVRVLAPGGVAIVGGEKTVKPRPEEIDEWPQYLHGADNNAVADDSAVGPPRHIQWVDRPAWSRSHMSIPTVVAMVSAGGRLMTIEDRATPENPFLPGRFKLIARDAFNGIVLWRRDLADWEPVTRYVKDIAVQLQRRLACIDERVYCTLGLSAPLTALEAATGKTVKTYKGTERTQEFAYHRGVLYLVIGDRMNAARYNIVKPERWRGKNLGGSDPKAPFGGTGFGGAYAPQTPDKPDPTCVIVAVEADSGKRLWTTKPLHHYTACTLAIRGDRAVYQTSGGLFCVKARTGEKIWSVKKPIKSGDGTESNTVILTDDAVYAQEGNTFGAYSLADGKARWKAPIANNYEKSADLFLAAGRVWTGGSKQPASYDPKTGRKIKTIPQRMKGPMSHDRCYRNFITNKYYINSKTGGADFLDLRSGREFPHHWTRGTCGMGVLPCNGLLYVPPYSCQCSIGAMIKDFNALYTARGLKSPGQDIPVAREARLIKGPAYAKIRQSASAEIGGRDKGLRNPKDAGRPISRPPISDWPTYRHDPTRGGVTESKVPTDLAPVWKTKLRTTPSAPVVAAGKVFVCEVDAHAVCALDARNGKLLWTYVAGGRVDSPPTYYEGLLLFGSRDGWVHCLRASDGEPAWRFKDLPDRLIAARGRLESAWPVSGSVLVMNDLAYFAAGRSSFLDGGIFLYALNPRTGEVVHSRRAYGPFDKGTGFPATKNQGSKSDILVGDLPTGQAGGKRVYMRHKAFGADLADAGPGVHLIPSAGFVDARPQHRTYWTVATGFSGKTMVRGASGDILVTDGESYYEVLGFPVHRHSYFDPRVRGYRLRAGAVGDGGGRDPKSTRRGRRGKGKRAAKTESPEKDPAGKWSGNIPLTGKAMVLAGGVVFVAGTPAHFPPRHLAEKYEAAYEGKLGGVLWAASAEDGKKLGEYKLQAPPAWDGMAAAGGRLYISLQDGSVICMGKKGN